MSNNTEPIRENGFIFKILSNSLSLSNIKLLSFKNVATSVHGYFKYCAQIEYNGSILYSSCMISEAEAQDLDAIVPRYKRAIKEFEQIMRNPKEQPLLDLIYYSLMSKNGQIIKPYSVSGSDWAFVMAYLNDFVKSIKKSKGKRVSKQEIYDICLRDFNSFISKKI